MTRRDVWADRLIIALLWVGIGLASIISPGCSAASQQTQAQHAAVVAVSANEVLPLLEARYVLAMKMEVDDVATRGGTREEAQAEVDRVKREWLPVWAAWDAFAEAHAVWRVALQADDEADAVKAAIHARAAFCALQRLVPDIPDMPLVECSP